MFIDYAEILVRSGNGGDGAVAFRREKYVPKGGPAGGNGGDGGSVIIIADHNLHTLLDFKYNRKYEAGSGAPGGTSLKDGKNGEDAVIKVPVGTLIKDKSSGEILYDFKEENSTLVIAKGGKGGKGNSNFATSTNQAPRFAENGKPGEEKNIILELKLIADVGLVGFPNAGKSTFISSVSAARPKIADYPFTTLKPNLGIVHYKDHQSMTVADIPGIIEGAHEGKGLGLQFLRHIERTKVLLIMIESIAEDIQVQYSTLINELKNYSEVLSKKKTVVAISKIDLLSEDDIKELKKLKLENYSGEIYFLSSVTKQGIEKILDVLWNMLSE